MINTPSKHTAKPFLKWAGGKGQLIDQIRERIPGGVAPRGVIEKYFEPFVGGGAVFFWLSQQYEIKKAYLYDINPEIIMAYRTIKSDVRSLIRQLKSLEKKYRQLPKLSREAYYYNCRERYNACITKKSADDAVKRTALLIFLNRTCFNGLFRVNSKGLFNVPFGRYENPTICDEQNLLAVSGALANAELKCCDFAECLKRADSRSLVYFDPPYRPISKTANFTGYIKNGFSDEDQKRLKDVYDRLDQVGAKVILSNSDPKNVDPDDEFFDALYKGYNIERLKAIRMINCDAEKRGQIKEILVMNYPSGTAV